MGVLAALLTIAVAVVSPEAARLPMLAVLLGLAAGVYPGFAMRQERAAASRLQWGVALTFAAIAVSGLTWSPWWLAAGWLLHAGWDALHHAGRRGDYVPRAYPMFCLAYDVPLAAYAAWIASGGTAG